jgi:hypothetical protein
MRLSLHARTLASAVTVLTLLTACTAGSPPPVSGAVDASGGPGDSGSAIDTAPVAWAMATPAVLGRRLARFLWAQEEDASTVRSLEEGPPTPDGVARVAESMLLDARARRGVVGFYKWWLLLDVLPTLDKEDPDGVLDPAMRRSMMEEAPALGTFLTLDTEGTLTDLLTADFTFVDERLARHYGMEGVAGTDFRKVAYPGGQPRVGLVSGAGVLSVFASLSTPSWPVKRGWLVTDQLLCTPVIRSFLPPSTPDPNRSLREQMIEVTSAGSCMACHRILNSPGFALIGFDSFGRWRPEPGHGPGETAGWIPEEIMPDAPKFEGIAQLAALLASRSETRRCFVRQWLQFAVDRATVVRSEVPQPLAASIAEASAAFERSGLSLRSLIIAITRTEAFTRP